MQTKEQYESAHDKSQDAEARRTVFPHRRVFLNTGSSLHRPQDGTRTDVKLN